VWKNFSAAYNCCYRFHDDFNNKCSSHDQQSTVGRCNRT
jgi:hypothetical protein